MRRPLRVLAAASASLVITASAHAATITDLGAWDGVGGFRPVAASDGGYVAGARVVATSPDEYGHAAVWKDGAVSDLGTIDPPGAQGPGTSSLALDVNDAGRVVGASNVDVDFGGLHAFWWQGSGALRDLGVLDDAVLSPQSMARGVNASGAVVGDSVRGVGQGEPTQGFRWGGSGAIAPFPTTGEAGDLTLFAVSDTGTRLVGVRGWDEAAGTGAGIVVTGTRIDTLPFVPGRHGLSADGRWAAGTVAGVAHRFDADARTDAVLPDREGASSSAASAVNGNGVVAGTSGGRAVVWVAGADAPLDLTSLLDAGSGWALQSALDITDGGLVLGYGTKDGVRHGFLLDPGLCLAPAPKQALRRSGCGANAIDWTMPERLTATTNAITTGSYGSASHTYVYPATWHLDLKLKSGAVAFGDPTDCSTAATALVQWRWKVTPAAKVARAPKPGCKPGMDVTALGKYQVVARRYTRATPSAAWTYSGRQLTKTVEAKDWLIVGIGDSNGSGEGNKPFFYPRCNRSRTSYQFKTARFLEQQDRRSSVTFVFTACSGARVHHLTTMPYAGTRAASPKLPPQIDQVLVALANPKGKPRHPDAVLVSIGVNDLAFGAVGEWCFYHPASPLPGSRQCQTLRVRYHANPAEADYSFTFGSTGDRTVAQFVAAFTRGLGAKLKALRQRLVQPVDTYRGLGIPPKHVFLALYPDFSTDQDGTTCDTSGFAAALFRWNRATWTWWGSAQRQLNSAIRASASPSIGGWQVTPLADNAFAGHGYCAGRVPTFDQSWFRGLLRGRVFDDKAGPLHPVEEGHQLEADAIEVPFCKTLYGNTSCVGTWRF